MQESRFLSGDSLLKGNLACFIHEAAPMEVAVIKLSLPQNNAE